MQVIKSAGVKVVVRVNKPRVIKLGREDAPDKNLLRGVKALKLVS